MIQETTLRFHTQLKILYKKGSFRTFDSYITPYFAQDFDFLEFPRIDKGSLPRIWAQGLTLCERFSGF